MQSLSIVIPAYNEERRLPATLYAIAAWLESRPWTFVEMIVVNDGSRDGTAGVAREFAAEDPRVRLLENPGNRGKGYSVRHGFEEARGEWVLFTDADLSSPIEEFAKLEAAAAGENAQIAIGSRALNRALIGVRQPFYREWMGRFFNLVMRLETGLPLHDTQCGFKLFRADAARALAARQLDDGFGFDVEILYLARKLGYRIAEVPVRWNDAAGTKVSLWKGLLAFLTPLGVRWNDLRGRYAKRG